jgi:hypothetical protein
VKGKGSGVVLLTGRIADLLKRRRAASCEYALDVDALSELVAARFVLMAPAFFRMAPRACQKTFCAPANPNRNEASSFVDVATFSLHLNAAFYLPAVNYRL